YYLHHFLLSSTTRRSSDLEPLVALQLERSLVRPLPLAQRLVVAQPGRLAVLLDGIERRRGHEDVAPFQQLRQLLEEEGQEQRLEDRKSTRLNSSHVKNSYA